jgi:hypothetical protein
MPQEKIAIWIRRLRNIIVAGVCYGIDKSHAPLLKIQCEHIKAMIFSGDTQFTFNNGCKVQILRLKNAVIARQLN